MSISFAAKKTFKGFTLDLQFDSENGRLGILGASGCGKSMTLKCIAGIVKPDEGRIVINDRVLFDSAQKIDIKPQQRQVGYLFQNYALFPHMRVSENIACGMGLSKKEARQDKYVKELIGMLHLEGLEDRYPGQLSGGQQQRVALARILAYKPQIIMLDEPFSALDEYLKEKLHLQLTEMLRDWGHDVILVTHNRDEVFKICDKLLIMDSGKKISMGKVQALFDDPGNIRTARLTGCKNISAARKLDAHRLEALDWGIVLETEREVPDELKAVGIRAHEFVPAESGAPNLILVNVADTNDGPFERNVIFNCGGKSDLWWKFPRDAADASIPGTISLPPEKLLLLTAD